MEGGGGVSGWAKLGGGRFLILADPEVDLS